MATFAEALRTARSGAGWSQQQLADAIHVSRTMIGHYESDAHPVIPPRERVLAIAKALDLTPLATDRLLAAAGYGAEYPVDPGELAGMLHLEEARITEAHVTHLVVDHLEGPPIASGGRPPGRADFYAYISLPPNYVTRAEVLAEIRAVVLGTVPAIALTSVIQGKPTALHGMGGIGKSVIARALCEDPEVQAAFPDGILWATLGQTPDLITRLREWIGALGGTVSEHAPTEGSLKATLADLFKERACLLILDDAWQRTHVEVFQVGGSRCRLLFTTRDAEIARELGARVQPIPLMTRGEAITLLEEWADGQLAEVASTLKAQIVERLGRLPLAVKLAGAQLQRKAADEWLRTFDARRLRLRRLEAIHDSLEATFGLSLDALDADTRRLYVALAIFKEDEPIHQAGIAKLWQALGGLDRDATADLLDDLAARALLEYRTMESTTGTSIRTAMSARHAGVVLHDLLREFIAAELGEGRRAAHQAILAAYRATCLGAGWHTAPDDRYLYDHLAYHLHAVGPADEFKALFADQDWMNVRIPQSAYTYDGYLADLDLAWAQADTEARRQIKAGQNLTAFADCVRYALIRTSGRPQ